MGHMGGVGHTHTWIPHNPLPPDPNSGPPLLPAICFFSFYIIMFGVLFVITFIVSVLVPAAPSVNIPLILLLFCSCSFNVVRGGTAVG